MDFLITNTSLTIARCIDNPEINTLVNRTLAKTCHQLAALEDLSVSYDMLITDSEKTAKASLQALNHAELTAILLFSQDNTRILQAAPDKNVIFDILYWPINAELFMSRVGKICTIIARDRLLNIKEAEISEYHKLMIAEQAIAKNIFEEFVKTNELNYPEVDFLLSPLSTYNGDILLAHKNNNAILNVMLGDFTGHGLPAAIGSIPTAEIFYAMSEKGISIDLIAKEINTKLVQLLPTHLFCAACLFSYDIHSGKLSVWQGGLPLGFVMNEDGSHIFELHSKHLPLGVLTEKDFNHEVEVFEINEPMKLTLFTDGFVERKNVAGEILAQERIVECLKENTSREQISALQDLFQSHMHQVAILDDVAIACVVLNV